MKINFSKAALVSLYVLDLAACSPEIEQIDVSGETMGTIHL